MRPFCTAITIATGLAVQIIIDVKFLRHAVVSQLEILRPQSVENSSFRIFDKGRHQYFRCFNVKSRRRGLSGAALGGKGKE